MSLTKVTYSMIDGASANVTDYGADSTGTNDSTAAIQAAIDSGKSVYLPSGTYKVSELTLDNAGQIFYGDGARETIINNINKTDTVLSVTAEHCTVRDVTFTATVPPDTLGDVAPVAINTSGGFTTIQNCGINAWALGVQISDNIRSTVQNCKINVGEFSYYGIGITGGGEHTLDNNAVFDNSGDKFAGVALVYVYNSPANVISNNYISRGRAIGLRVTAPVGSFSNAYTVITNNDIDFIYNWAIYIQNQTQVHIKDNWCSCGQRWNGTLPASGANVYNDATGQISIRDTKEFFVTHNDIYQSQGESGGGVTITPQQPSYGLYVYNSQFGVISGNVSQDNSVGFYSVQSSQNNQFIANTTGQLIGLANEGTPQYVGFQEDNTSYNNVYTSNIVYGLPTGGIAYDNIESFAVPDVNTVASWINNSYGTFTSSGAQITSAITSGVSNADTGNFYVEAGKYYQVTAYLVLNSGQAPSLGAYDGTGGSFDKSPSALSAGFNTFTYQASVTGTSAHLNLSNSAASNFTLNIKLIEITF